MPDARVKMFPIMSGSGSYRGTITEIPWSTISKHARQARENHYQTIERLAERGGLWASEAVAVLEDREWHHMDLSAAEKRLRELIRL